MPLPQEPSIQSLFNQISPQYDRFNHISSLGRDVFWREQALKVIQPGMRVLDLGTGTGDLALGALGRIKGQGEVIGLDFSGRMLQLAEEKRIQHGITGPIRWVQKSAEEIPFEEEPYDAVISGFVLRNLYSNIHSILEGVYRGLRRGGVISFVDLTEQENPCVRFFSRIYMKTLVQLWGRWFFGNSHPVHYLQGSMQRFFRAREFVDVLKRVGFEDIRTRSYWFGAVTQYTAWKR